MKWEIIKEKTKDHWLELKGDDGSRTWHEGEDEKKDGVPIYPYYAICKWDGCVHFYQWSNGKGYGHDCNDKCDCCEEYTHICDVDDFVEMLKALKEKGKEYFKDKSGSEYWS